MMIDKDLGDWSTGSDGGFKFKNRLIVLESSDIKKDILEESHRSRLTVHLGGTKMYKDLKRTFWWEGMKREVAKFVRVFALSVLRLSTENHQDFCSHY